MVPRHPYRPHGDQRLERTQLVKPDSNIKKESPKELQSPRLASVPRHQLVITAKPRAFPKRDYTDLLSIVPLNSYFVTSQTLA